MAKDYMGSIGQANSPLGGFIKQLVIGNFSKLVTDQMRKKAYFFFWMSPNQNTIRLLSNSSQSSMNYSSMYEWSPLYCFFVQFSKLTKLFCVLRHDVAVWYQFTAKTDVFI